MRCCSLPVSLDSLTCAPSYQIVYLDVSMYCDISITFCGTFIIDMPVNSRHQLINQQSFIYQLYLQYSLSFVMWQH